MHNGIKGFLICESDTTEWKIKNYINRTIVDFQIQYVYNIPGLEDGLPATMKKLVDLVYPHVDKLILLKANGEAVAAWFGHGGSIPYTPPEFYSIDLSNYRQFKTERRNMNSNTQVLY